MEGGKERYTEVIFKKGCDNMDKINDFEVIKTENGYELIS